MNVELTQHFHHNSSHDDTCTMKSALGQILQTCVYYVSRETLSTQDLAVIQTCDGTARKLHHPTTHALLG